MLWHTVYLERAVQPMQGRGIKLDSGYAIPFTSWLGAHQPHRRLRLATKPETSGGKKVRTLRPLPGLNVLYFFDFSEAISYNPWISPDAIF